MAFLTLWWHSIVSRVESERLTSSSTRTNYNMFPLLPDTDLFERPQVLTVYQSCWEAKRAPSARACSFAQAISGSTVEDPAKVAKPQSVPAITRSRPTREAKRA